MREYMRDVAICSNAVCWLLIIGYLLMSSASGWQLLTEVKDGYSWRQTWWVGDLAVQWNRMTWWRNDKSHDILKILLRSLVERRLNDKCFATYSRKGVLFYFISTTNAHEKVLTKKVACQYSFFVLSTNTSFLKLYMMVNFGTAFISAGGI